MKTRTIIGFVALALVLALALSGCAFPPPSIEQRIGMFVGDLNSADRPNAYENFSKTETADYDSIKSGTTWDTQFPQGTEADPKYSASITDATDPLAVLVTISGPPIFLGPIDYKFVMVGEITESGDTNWLIHELWIWAWNDTLPTPAWEWQAIIQ